MQLVHGEYSANRLLRGSRAALVVVVGLSVAPYGTGQPKAVPTKERGTHAQDTSDLVVLMLCIQIVVDIGIATQMLWRSKDGAMIQVQVIVSSS